MKVRAKISRVSAGLGVLLSAAAYGQTANAADELAEVVITGSRTITNGNDSPTPVTVVTTDQLLDVQPQTVVQALQTLPVFAGSQGQNTNPGGASTNSGAAILNMRNLGLLRSLALFDGHRLPSTSPNGTVDVNMVPQMLLQRVEVVTGGASAVYGSDAVSGVVNFITDTKFEGVKAKVQYGQSEYHDAKTWDAGLAAGMFFADRKGHLEFGYQYHDDPGIFTRLTRPWGQAVYTVQGNGLETNPYRLVRNSRNSTSSFGGLISARNIPTSNGVALNNFSSNGVLTPFVNGAATGTSGIQSGGDGTFFYPSSQKTAYLSHQGFARVDYDFTDQTHAYFEIAAAGNWNRNIWGPNSLASVPISTRNAFLSPSYQAMIAANTAPPSATPSTTFAFSKVFLGFPPVTVESYEKQFFALADLAGKLGDDFKWDLAYSHSQTKQNTRQLGNMNKNRLYAALDAVDEGVQRGGAANGNIVCRVTVTNPGLYPGCAPMNVFGPTSESQASIDWVGQRTEHWAITKMDDFTASLVGAPASTWAGPLNMALSGEWRRTAFNDISNALPTDVMNCLGLPYCTPGAALWQSGSYGPWLPRTQTVSEGAYEIDAPLAKDLPFAQDLSVNAAARYAYYSTNGGVWAWKFGVDWHINDTFTVRGTRSRDIRAPNLNDLYAPSLTTRNTFTDSFTSQNIPNFDLTSRGNPDLSPELADTKTLGIVIRPEGLPGFSMAVDGYETIIDNAIVTLSGGTPTVQKACADSNGASPYCALIVRPLPYYNPNGSPNNLPSNNATTAYTVPINAAYIKTYGADLEVNYSTAVFSRPTTARLLVTYQPHLLIVTPGLSNIDMGGAAFGSVPGFFSTPSVRVTAILNFKPIDALSVTLLERWRNSMYWNGDRALVYAEPKIKSVAYTNLNLAYTIDTASKGEFEVFLNVQNLFSQSPRVAIGPGSTAGQNAANVDGDDNIGRYYTLGMRYQF